MSALAKVFTVLVLIMSLAFFGTSVTLYKTRTDWRGAMNKVEADAKKKLQELEAHNATIAAQRDALEKTRIELAANNNEMSTKLKQTFEDLKEEKTKGSQHAANAAKSADVASQLAKTVESKDTLYAQLNEQLTKSKTDLDNALQLKATADKRHDSMKIDLEKSQTELHSTRTELAKLSEDFQTLELKYNGLAARVPGAAAAGVTVPVDAVIKAVDSKEKLVLLSAGKDQKVQLGDEFTVYRGSDFVGRVKVIKLFPDLAGAEIQYTKDGTAIQQGDKASSQLN